MSSEKSLDQIKLDCQKTVLGLHKKGNAGHIGTSLSCLDILIYLFFKEMKEEDKFVLSKGHGAAALYTVLAESGHIEKELLDSYYADGTLLAAHPPCAPGKVPGITFGTGSLGHGLSLAAGMALSTRYTGKKFNTYVVVSDGDCNEGSTWEAVMFAAHNKLSNLTVIVDNNDLQGFGTTHEVIEMGSLRKKWEAFDFEVVEAKNGNNFTDLEEAFTELEKRNSDKPRCIIAKTTKGSGISYMENKLEWHYLPMTDEQYQTALSEIGASHA